MRNIVVEVTEKITICKRVALLLEDDADQSVIEMYALEKAYELPPVKDSSGWTTIESDGIRFNQISSEVVDVPLANRRFKVLDPNDSNANVLGGAVGIGNVFISIYPVISGKRPDQLKLNESTAAEYQMGKASAEYHIVRIK